MNITVNIQAPELAKSIEALAAALSGNSSLLNSIHSTMSQVGREALKDVAPAVQQPAPIQQQAPAPVPTYQTPPVAQQPVPTYQAAPSAPVTQQPPQPVPTTAPQYDMNQLAVACTQLMDAGRVAELHQLLAAFNVQALTQLPHEQYGAFATKLRELGARL